jgi:hypothetical protein
LNATPKSKEEQENSKVLCNNFIAFPFYVIIIIFISIKRIKQYKSPENIYGTFLQIKFDDNKNVVMNPLIRAFS